MLDKLTMGDMEGKKNKNWQKYKANPPKEALVYWTEIVYEDGQKLINEIGLDFS